MTNKLKQKMMVASAATFLGLVSGVENASANNFGTVVTNIGASIATLPGLISGVSYMMGVTLGVLGVLKIKDHVENPGQTPLQQGAIRLAAGGGLFALPMVYEAMTNTIDGAGVGAVTAPSTLKGITVLTN